jgi:hypothetical protein
VSVPGDPLHREIALARQGGRKIQISLEPIFGRNVVEERQGKTPIAFSMD